jgi:hypothetical protein
MALLGASIDPSLFRQDYSGFVNAANTNANAIAGLGQTIANTATDYFKDQNDKKKVLKQSSTQIDAAIKLYPELQGAFAPILDNLRDENISLNDRFASASATPGLIELAIGQSNKNREFGLKTRELNVQEGRYKRQDTSEQNQLGQQNQQDISTSVGLFQSLGERLTPEQVATATDLIQSGRGSNSKAYLEAIFKGLPTNEQNKVIEIGTKNGGVAGTIPMLLNTTTGVTKNITPPEDALPIDNPPPLDIPTVEGIILPANETVLSTDRKTATYQGKTYTVDDGVLQPKEPAPPPPFGFKPAGGSLVSVNTGDAPQQQRESAIDKSLLIIKDEAAQAASQLSKINEISDLLNKGVETGFAQDVLMQAGKVFGQDVSNQEAFKAASGSVALGFINLTKGAISDTEMTYFTQVLAPSIGTSVEGNKKIADYLRRSAEKAAKVEEIISTGMRSGKSAFDIDSEVQKFRNTETIIPKEVIRQNQRSPEAQAMQEELDAIKAGK